MSILYGARALLALLQPMTGPRAEGTVLVRSTGATGTIEHSSHCCPILGSSIRPELLFKTAGNPDTETRHWPVTKAGTSIPLLSVLGGGVHNLAEGTELRWLPTPDGIEPVATVRATGLSGGASNQSYVGVSGVRLFEQIPAGPTAAIETMKAALPGFPGLVLVWDGSEPDDGQKEQPLGDRQSRLGKNSTLMRESWVLFVLTSRLDTDPARREQGLALVDEIRETITQRQKVDEMVFSSIRGLSVHSCKRWFVGSQLYVYAVQFSTANVLTKRDLRQFGPWLKTRLDAQTPDTPPLPTVVDDERNMPE